MGEKSREKRLRKNGRYYCPAGVIDCIQEFAHGKWNKDGFITPTILRVLDSETKIDENGETLYIDKDTIIDKGITSAILWRRSELPSWMLVHIMEKDFDKAVLDVEYGLNQIMDDIAPDIERKQNICESIYELYSDVKERLSHEKIKKQAEISYLNCKENHYSNICHYVSLNLCYTAKYTSNIIKGNTTSAPKILQDNNRKYLNLRRVFFIFMVGTYRRVTGDPSSDITFRLFSSIIETKNLPEDLNIDQSLKALLFRESKHFIPYLKKFSQRYRDMEEIYNDLDSHKEKWSTGIYEAFLKATDPNSTDPPFFGEENTEYLIEIYKYDKCHFLADILYLTIF